jgi:acetyl-CoA carboxylase biotin carboxyl carrier protein
MDFNQIQELIRLITKQKITEFVLKDGEFKLEIRQGGTSTEGAAPAPQQVMMPAAPQIVAMPAPVAPAPVAAPAPVQAPAPAPAADGVPANAITIKSPMVGTFYRSSGPDKGPFVKVGDTIDTGTTVCIIEAMKLFNEIESDVKGKIVKVLVEDATPVEYDQPLFMVEPA